MLQLINFLIRNRGTILFLFLEFIAFVFIINTHSFHYSKYLDSANFISGGIYNKTTALSDYFKLKALNKDLIKENLLLKNKLEQFTEKEHTNLLSKDSVKYSYITAKVIQNNYRNKNNILTINKGELDGIKPNMGVVLSNGLVGITLNTSKHFTTVLSLLNNQASFNVKLSKSHHYGSLVWEDSDFSTINIVDLPIQANIKVGDSIISGGKSILFPEGIPIGVIADFKIKDKSYESIKIKLFIDFSALHQVYVVKNRLSAEQIQLEKGHE